MIKINLVVLAMMKVDTQWKLRPISQSHFHVSHLCSLSFLCDVCIEVYEHM